MDDKVHEKSDDKKDTRSVSFLSRRACDTLKCLLIITSVTLRENCSSGATIARQPNHPKSSVSFYTLKAEIWCVQHPTQKPSVTKKFCPIGAVQVLEIWPMICVEKHTVFFSFSPVLKFSKFQSELAITTASNELKFRLVLDFDHIECLTLNFSLIA